MDECPEFDLVRLLWIDVWLSAFCWDDWNDPGQRSLSTPAGTPVGVELCVNRDVQKPVAICRHIALCVLDCASNEPGTTLFFFAFCFVIFDTSLFGHYLKMFILKL